MLTPAHQAAADGASAGLTFTLVALLRADGHLCNVLTHVSSGDWRAVEQAINAIIEPPMPAQKLSNIDRNILELLCDDRGITGRIMRPFFFEAIGRVAGEAGRKRLEARIQRSRHLMSCEPQAPPAPKAPRQACRRERSSKYARVRPFPVFAASPQPVNGVSP